jgi:hypothetical protein
MGPTPHTDLGRCSWFIICQGEIEVLEPAGLLCSEYRFVRIYFCFQKDTGKLAFVCESVVYLQTS